MVIIPKEKPVIENLNSYYLDIRKLFEHYQGELGSGCIHFRSTITEGVIFFDKDDLLAGIYSGREGEMQGKEAVSRLIEEADTDNFTISIYEIMPEEIYFWANMPAAEKIYKNLSAEFTDLEGLIKKMCSEKLTGYIDVSISNGKESGLIFFSNGDVTGGSYSWGEGEVNASKESQDLLIQKTKESGGIFQVSKISIKKKSIENESESIGREPTLSAVLTMLEEFIGICDRVVTSNKAIKTGFNTLLKRKFIEKTSQYEFLDPFVAEFEYADGKLSFAGHVSKENLIKGVVESIKELSLDLGILSQLENKLRPWSLKYAVETKKYGVGF